MVQRYGPCHVVWYEKMHAVMLILCF
uniref:Uncharacterized protein n=1 Tax=Anguilla anguilla TaxID=7936 RepID=A0A0E9XX46_ANGAN